MKILGIDTSGYTNAIGVVSDGEILADCSFDARTDSLEQIVDNIDSTLKSAGSALDDIDGVGVGLGSGSWTGIRVGVTTGKMLAFAADKPVAGISTLEALAYPVRDKATHIVTAIYAGTGDNVYGAFYHSNVDGLQISGDYFYGNIGELLKKITGSSVLVVSGRDFSDISEKHEVISAKPNGAVVALLAEKKLQSGDVDDTLSLTPLYLKESTAKVHVNKYTSGERKV